MGAVVDVAARQDSPSAYVALPLQERESVLVCVCECVCVGVSPPAAVEKMLIFEPTTALALAAQTLHTEPPPKAAATKRKKKHSFNGKAVAALCVCVGVEVW